MSFKVVDKTAVVSYPDSPSSSYTAAAVRKALSHHLSDFRICNTVTEAAREFSEATGEKPVPALQVSDYDEIDWDGLKELEDQVLVNAYPIRKVRNLLHHTYTLLKKDFQALIRKNALHSTFHHHTSKHPSCTLLSSVPQTFSFDLAFPDELDELFADDLYELGQALDSDEGGWWILKPAMAERGQGIRIFRTREELEAIFEEFEVSSDDEEEDDEGGAPTAVSMSQLRQWIIQVGGTAFQHVQGSSFTSTALHRESPLDRSPRCRRAFGAEIKKASSPCLRPRSRRTRVRTPPAVFFPTS